MRYDLCRMHTVKAVLAALDRLNISHLIMARKINFYRHLFTSGNCVIYNVFIISFLLRGHDEMSMSVFVNKSSALEEVFEKFRLYACV